MLNPSELVEFETSPGSNSGFPAHRYSAVGASVEEIRELFHRHQALSTEDQIKFTEDLATRPNSHIEAQLGALRSAIKSGDTSPGASGSDRQFPGTVDEVLAKVGTDTGAAQAALTEEQAQPTPRAKLITELGKIVLPPAAPATPAADAAGGSPGA